MEQTAIAPVDVQPNQHVGNTDTSREAPVVTPEPDLVTKVSQFRKESEQTFQKKELTPEEIAGTWKKYDRITDEKLRNELIEADKKNTGEFTKRSQELSRLREENESLRKRTSDWSPERIQRELLNNPQFLQAAQQIAAPPTSNPANSGLTNEEFSALTDREKQEMSVMKQQVNLLQQANYQARVSQEDAQLQTKYADYNPQEINELWNDLSTGRVQATREHLYIIKNHHSLVEAAYKYGIQQAKQLNQERANGITNSGMQTQDSSGLPVREKGERDESFFVKLAQFRLSQRKK